MPNTLKKHVVKSIKSKKLSKQNKIINDKLLSTAYAKLKEKVTKM